MHSRSSIQGPLLSSSSIRSSFSSIKPPSLSGLSPECRAQQKKIASFADAHEEVVGLDLMMDEVAGMDVIDAGDLRVGTV